MEFTFEQYQQSAAYIHSCLNGFVPDVAMVLGSGLGYLGDQVEDAIVVPYGQIPHFKASTAPGHKGQLVFGRLEGKNVAVMQGRMHHYEGYSYQEVAYAIRVLRLLGCQTLIVTNAAGCVRTDWEVGELMLITDHINFSGSNPLIGPHEPEFGPRFPDVTDLYSANLRLKVKLAAVEAGITLRQGVYMMFSGPSYETPAEIRMARILGADAVGMSTVPEALVAAQCGIKCLGISCITNLAAGVSPHKLSHEEVMETTAMAHDKFHSLIDLVLKEI